MGEGDVPGDVNAYVPDGIAVTDTTAALSPVRPADASQMPAPRSLARTDARAGELRRLRKAAGDFESLFLAQLLHTMQRTVGDDPRGSGYGSEIMLGVAQEKMAEALAEKGGLGLGEMLYESLRDRIVPDTTSPASGETRTRVEPIPLEPEAPNSIPLGPRNALRALPPVRSTRQADHPIDKVGP